MQIGSNVHAQTSTDTLPNGHLCGMHEPPSSQSEGPLHRANEVLWEVLWLEHSERDLQEGLWTPEALTGMQQICSLGQSGPQVRR